MSITNSPSALYSVITSAAFAASSSSTVFDSGASMTYDAGCWQKQICFRGMSRGMPLYAKSRYNTSRSGKVVNSIISSSKCVIWATMTLRTSPLNSKSTHTFGNNPFWRANPLCMLRFSKMIFCIVGSWIFPCFRRIIWVAKDDTWMSSIKSLGS